jgi:hypothetical protein
MAGPGSLRGDLRFGLKIIRLTVLIIAPAFSPFKGLFAPTGRCADPIYIRPMERSGGAKQSRGGFSERKVLERLGGVRSQIRTGLHWQFPGNREIYREFRDFAAFGGRFLVRSRCAAAASRKIP